MNQRLNMLTGNWEPVIRRQRGPQPFGVIGAKSGRFVSSSLPLNYPFAKDHDAMGRPRFNSQQEVRETVARANDTGEELVYDD